MHRVMIVKCPSSNGTSVTHPYLKPRSIVEEGAERLQEGPGRHCCKQCLLDVTGMLCPGLSKAGLPVQDLYKIQHSSQDVGKGSQDPSPV